MTPLAHLENLHRAGLRREAVAYARALVARDPTRDHLHALGAVELAIGHTINSASAFERAIALSKFTSPQIYNDLGVCYAQMGLFERALHPFEQAVAAPDVAPKALANRGAALLRLGQPAEAAADFISSLAQAPQAQTALGLVRAWTQMGDRKSAATLIDQILVSGAESFGALDALLELQLLSAAQRFSWAKRLLLKEPTHEGLRALFIRAARAAGDPEGEEVYRSYRSLVEVTNLPEKCRLGCVSLQQQVLSHPSMRVAPAHHATVGGQHSGDLFSDPDVELEELRAAIHAEVHRYLDCLRARASTHPHFTQRPREVQIHAWAVALEGSHHQQRHFHPEAWTSGCLYLMVPSHVSESESHGHFYFDGPAGTRDTVCPHVGRVVLFPSCLDHGTLPQRSPGVRLSVAFDVVAGGSAA